MVLATRNDSKFKPQIGRSYIKIIRRQIDKSVSSNTAQNDLSSITHIDFTSYVDQKSPYEKCKKDECLNQREILTHIFDHFELQVSDNHECLWGGVSCNDDEQVNHIWFENMIPRGKEIPTLLGELPRLKTLYLGRLGINGTIPNNIWQLTNMEDNKFYLNAANFLSPRKYIKCGFGKDKNEQ